MKKKNQIVSNLSDKLKKEEILRLKAIIDNTIKFYSTKKNEADT
jgi:hypothetical protein